MWDVSVCLSTPPTNHFENVQQIFILYYTILLPLTIVIAQGKKEIIKSALICD